MRSPEPQIAATTLKIYALIIIVTSALACVKPINAGVRVYVVCVVPGCARTCGWTRATDRQPQYARRARNPPSSRLPPPPMDMCEEGPRGLLRRGGLSPPFKMATSHSSIGLDMTAPPRARSTTVLSSGFTPLRVTRTQD